MFKCGYQTQLKISEAMLFEPTSSESTSLGWFLFLFVTIEFLDASVPWFMSMKVYHNEVSCVLHSKMACQASVYCSPHSFTATVISQQVLTKNNESFSVCSRASKNLPCFGVQENPVWIFANLYFLYQGL